ncbi:MAG: hypothetical protein JNK76_14125 [Planctomycetales bacterium]|nr:hypothetical protein [Planctomycetales bacterium]
MRSFFVRFCFALAAGCGMSASADAGGFVVTTAQPLVATTAIVSPFVTATNIVAAPVVVSAPVVATPQFVQLQAVPTVIASPAIVSARQLVRNVVVRQRIIRALCR